MASGHRVRCLRRLASATRACGIVRELAAGEASPGAIWDTAGECGRGGVSAVLAKPPMKRISADAPRCGAAGPGVPDDAARRLLPAVHRAVVRRHPPGLGRRRRPCRLTTKVE